MKLHITLSILLLISIQFIYPQQEKTFKVSNGGKLEMNVNFGDIRIETGAANEVVVRADDEWESDDKINQTGNTIKIVSDYPKDYRIIIPQEFSISIVSSGGDITVSGNLTGDLSLTTAAGSISFNEINGSLKANTGGGDIKGTNISGKSSINTAGGDISLKRVGELTLNTAGGDIQIESLNKSATVNTGGGNITLGSLDGKTSVRTGGGDVKVSSASSGVSILTGGGNMTISDSKGDIAIKSGGGDVNVVNKGGNVDIKTGEGIVIADLVPPQTGTSTINTGNGDVKVLIPENSKTTVRIITKEKHRSDVQINSDFSLTTEDIKDNESVTVYQINGGGSIIDIRSGFGTIELKKKK